MKLPGFLRNLMQARQTSDEPSGRMFLFSLRALFILLMAAVGYVALQDPDLLGNYTWLEYASLAIGLLIVAIDAFSPRKKVAVFAGTFLGIMVGIAIAYGLSFVVQLLVQQFVSGDNKKADAIMRFIDTMVGVASCYLSISFILQTKDDFRFIIPYVQFTRQIKGVQPILLDTSALIDGRITDVAATGVFQGQIVIPRFVLEELQQVADQYSDKLKRNRGRRGLDVVSKLRSAYRGEVILYEASVHVEPSDSGVDRKLVELARELGGRILTTDYNLGKVAQLSGVDVLNLNEMAEALRPILLPGENVRVAVVKPGEGSGQGVGYLPDGTMVVVEQAREIVGQEVDVIVTSALQTSAGRMIFARPIDGAGSRRGLVKSASVAPIATDK